MITSSVIAANSRELIVQLSRGNRTPARALAENMRTELTVILSSELDAASTLRLQAKQTMFAVEEVLSLMDQDDLPGAWESARDAAKEWRAATARE